MCIRDRDGSVSSGAEKNVGNVLCGRAIVCLEYYNVSTVSYTHLVTLIVIVTFFPIAIGLLEGFQSADKDTVNLLKAMGANRLQIFLHVKFPSSLGRFFASLRISVSYCVVGAVISEWLGGYNGLGVYMTRAVSYTHLKYSKTKRYA